MEIDGNNFVEIKCTCVDLFYEISIHDEFVLYLSHIQIQNIRATNFKERGEINHTPCRQVYSYHFLFCTKA